MYLRITHEEQETEEVARVGKKLRMTGRVLKQVWKPAGWEVAERRRRYQNQRMNMSEMRGSNTRSSHADPEESHPFDETRICICTEGMRLRLLRGPNSVRANGEHDSSEGAIGGLNEWRPEEPLGNEDSKRWYERRCRRGSAEQDSNVQASTAGWDWDEKQRREQCERAVIAHHHRMRAAVLQHQDKGGGNGDAGDVEMSKRSTRLRYESSQRWEKAARRRGGSEAGLGGSVREDGSHGEVVVDIVCLVGGVDWDGSVSEDGSGGYSFVVVGEKKPAQPH
ncbi:hypothetical protein C8R45DRAFT_947135 [Mycena sanguinolenta]|nr:hypothetical protein C8R45DRAFT_947135 [Mycena sanguinolenta]